MNVGIDELELKFLEYKHNELDVRLYPSKKGLSFNSLSEMKTFFQEEYNCWKKLKDFAQQQYNNQSNKIVQNIDKLNSLINYLNNYNSYYSHISGVITDLNNSFIYSSTKQGKLIIKWFARNNKQGLYAYALLHPQIGHYDTTEPLKYQEVSNSIIRLNNDESIDDLTVLDHYSEELDSIFTKYNKKLNLNEQEYNEYVQQKNNEIEEIKKGIDDYHLNSNQKLDELITRKNNELDKLNQSYKNLLTLKEPVKYWEELSEKYKNSAIIALSVAIVIGLLIFSFLSFVWFGVNKEILSDNNNVGSIINIKFTISTITIVSILTYTLSQCIKVFMSSRHLKIDAEERLQLTRIYLALLADETNPIQEGDRSIILHALFSRAETGLLKVDSSPSFPSSIIDLISKK